MILIPLSTAKTQGAGRQPGQGDARWAPSPSRCGTPSLMKEAENEIRELLRQRHRLQPYQEDDFNLRNLAEMLQSQEAASRVLTILLAAIASVSLLVGGIGIMNIMLVSVTERTREIGLRMAVGARGRDILTQFLVEAVTLSLIGGVIGIGAGPARLLRDRLLRGVAHRAAVRRDPARLRLLGRGRHLLRLLSGAQGGRAQSDRRAPVRMILRALLAAAVILLALAPAARAQTYTPQSSSRLAVSFTTERVGSGRVLIYGEVRNGTNASCERVVVGVEGLDENGRVVSRGRAYVFGVVPSRGSSSLRGPHVVPGLRAPLPRGDRVLPVRVLRELTCPDVKKRKSRRPARPRRRIRSRARRARAIPARRPGSRRPAHGPGGHRPRGQSGRAARPAHRGGAGPRGARPGRAAREAGRRDGDPLRGLRRERSRLLGTLSPRLDAGPARQAVPADPRLAARADPPLPGGHPGGRAFAPAPSAPGWTRARWPR